VVYVLNEGDDTWTAADQTLSFWVVHTTDAIYVAADVTDDDIVNDTVAANGEGNVWQDDSVEVLFDANHDHDVDTTPNPSGEFNGEQINFTANGGRRDSSSTTNFGPANAWFAATSRTAKGYQVEFKIMKSALLNPLDGATLGFIVALNDDDNASDPDRLQPKTYSVWSGWEFHEYTYGHLTLLAGSGGTGGDKLAISSIKVNNDKLELSFTTPKPSDTHVVEQTPNIAAAQWSEVANVVFSNGSGGSLVATFPKPTSSPLFYRVRL
jgi:hypothetical protein